MKWGDFRATDWKRIPGGARRYVNAKTGDEISRRQYLQHYGGATAYGTLEKRAKHLSKTEKQLLRPARGRKSALRLSETEKIVEYNKRKVNKREAEADKKIARELSKKRRAPKKITIDNFKRGKISRNVVLPIEFEPIEAVRQEAEDSKLVFGYMVGANLITSEGEDRTFVAIKLRSISKKFTERDYQNLLDKANEISYAKLVSFFVHLYLLC